MRKWCCIVVSALSIGVADSAVADMDADSEQMLRGAAGAAAGGLLGAQVGQGRGTTAAVVVGAGAGAVAASGCKATGKAVLGGLIGGLIGHQVGGGKNGRNAMAAAGAAVGTMAGADCAGAAPISGATQVPSRQAGRQQDYQPAATPRRLAAVVINGIRLSEVAAEFPMGRFSGFPRIQRKADYQALDALSRRYATAAWDAAAQQDWEAVAVNRHLGMRLVEYRLHAKLATMRFLASLNESRDGTGVLEPGATVFLPRFTRGEAKPAALTLGVDWSLGVQVADLGNSGIGALSNTQRATGAAGTPTVVADLPVGAVFSAHDADGNTFLVEKTPDGFNVGNPGARPVTVPLGQLGYVPDMPAPSAERQRTGVIVLNMQQVRKDLFWQAADLPHALTITSAMEAPNKIFVKNSSVRPVAVDQDGRLAVDPAAVQAGVAAYRSDRSYRDALNMADPSKHRDAQFESACLSLLGTSAYGTTYLGESAEILRHECYDKSRRPTQFRDYYVLNGQTMQTAASLLRDKTVASQLANTDATRDLAESVLGFVPFAGNIDAAAKCLTGTSITAATVNGYVNRGQGQYRPFVSDLLPPANDPSALESGLTCAQAVPLVGNAAKAAAKVGNIAGLYRDWSSSSSAAAVLRGLDLFDTSLIHTPNFAGLDGLAATSVATLKGFYDAMQVGANANQLGLL